MSAVDRTEFQALAEPIILWLRKKHQPHTAVVIDNSSASLVVAVEGFSIQWPLNPEEYEARQRAEGGDDG